MLLWRKPCAETIQRFTAAQAGQPLSYAAVGATATQPPAGYTVDRTRVRLGDGETVFAAAVAALAGWEHFRLGWVEVARPPVALEPGRVATIIIRVGGLWWLNAARIVYCLDETGPSPRFGFAYGTLIEHAESGEERFLVEQDAAGSVWYDILAFSRPRHPLARCGYSLVRRLQKRFGRDSAAAMQRAVARG